MKPLTAIEQNGLLIIWHLGLGDAIICNAIVRKFAAQFEYIVLPVKHHNVPSVDFMFRDLGNILIRPVDDDEEQLMFAQQVWKGQRLGLGVYGEGFDVKVWDQDFYRQSMLAFNMRWDGWKCDRERTKEKDISYLISEAPYAFVHDDPPRGFKIVQEPILPIVKPSKTETLFSWWKVIENAKLIHCICSSFSLFIDSIDLPKNPKLFLHSYCRPNEPLPQYRKNWEILK